MSLIEDVRISAQQISLALASNINLVKVKFPLELDPANKAQSEAYAMRRIRDGADLKDVLANVGLKLSPEAIRTVCEKVSPDTLNDLPPPESAQKFAEALFDPRS